MRLGILGGGQLARLMVPPAHRLGIEVRVLEKTETSPAGLAGAIHHTGDWNDPATCGEFARQVDVVTLDHEFACVEALEAAAESALLLPGVSTMRAIADKLVQKEHLAKAGIPTVESKAVASEDELRAVADDFGYPVIVKARNGGYDGKGNFRLERPEQIPEAFEQLSGPLYVERFSPFIKELAVMVARERDGRSLSYPVVETVQKNHICVAVHAVPDLSPEIVKRAQAVAEKAAEAVGTVGVLGVEMFLMEDGEVVVNELAPRPHNSGHYTQDACLTSQFENHVRAVCGFRLGSTEMVVEKAVMVNLLGDGFGSGTPQGLDQLLAHPQARLHLYGKTAKPGRKLGHLTLTGSGDLGALEAEAKELVSKLTFKEPQLT